VTTAAGAFVPAAFSTVRNSCVAVLEGPLGPEGDRDRLFAVIPHSRTPVVELAEVDHPEPYRCLDLTVSRPAHLGSQQNFGERITALSAFI